MDESEESDDEDPFLDASEEEMDTEQNDEVQESSDGEDD